MEYYYLFIVVVLLAIAVMDLIVGVSNDAVNFMNSAIGAKAAPRKYILLIAALGIVAGVTLSGGMMEVARKGIFNPQYFVMPELLVLFLAVMIQDILLLDLFNTYGLPTSTTVSIVFGLFGAAMGVSMIKVWEAGLSFDTVFVYINSGNVIKIFSAIFLSILIAFIVGSIVQWFVRLVLTFDFEKKIKRYGALLGGIALTLITFFILIKGSKGAAFMTDDVVQMMNKNSMLIAAGAFVFWTVILQLMLWFTRINILKVIVLIGTFSLAMAFAANDLVNFIGAPLAGLRSYIVAQGFENPLTGTMKALGGEVNVNGYLLLLAGIIMAVTLYFSKKARTVTKTEVSLGRQDEGYERFEAYPLSKLLVRLVINFLDGIAKIVPVNLRKRYRERFDSSKYKPQPDKNGEYPAFDLVRASVNLMVAAGLISIATNLKLPLSTTYVTFIVAMATALPDKAWGRDSAVYRVAGVMTVVGGWFMTAIIGSTVAFTFAVIIYYGKLPAIILLLLAASAVLIHTYRLHKKRAEKEEEREEKERERKETPVMVVEGILTDISNFITQINDILKKTNVGIINQDLKLLKKSKMEAYKLGQDLNFLVNDIIQLTKFSKDEEDLDHGLYFSGTLSSLNTITDHLKYITSQNHNYTSNTHPQFTNDQIDELKDLENSFNEILTKCTDNLKNKNFMEISKIENKAQEFKDKINKYNKKQLKRVKKGQAKIKRSRLYLESLYDLDEIIQGVLNIYNCGNQIYTMFYDGEYFYTEEFPSGVQGKFK